MKVRWERELLRRSEATATRRDPESDLERKRAGAGCCASKTLFLPQPPHCPVCCGVAGGGGRSQACLFPWGEENTAPSLR